MFLCYVKKLRYNWYNDIRYGIFLFIINKDEEFLIINSKRLWRSYK